LDLGFTLGTLLKVLPTHPFGIRVSLKGYAKAGRRLRQFIT